MLRFATGTLPLRKALLTGRTNVWKPLGVFPDLRCYGLRHGQAESLSTRGTKQALDQSRSIPAQVQLVPIERDDRQARLGTDTNMIAAKNAGVRSMFLTPYCTHGSSLRRNITPQFSDGTLSPDERRERIMK